MRQHQHRFRPAQQTFQPGWKNTNFNLTPCLPSQEPGNTICDIVCEVHLVVKAHFWKWALKIKQIRPLNIWACYTTPCSDGSFLDWIVMLLAGLPACAIKTLQMIQNAAASLVFNEPKRADITPLFVSLHWLPVAALIKYKAQRLVHRRVTGSAPL